tara:strand:- start:326 stop:1441 length:1116 start_codon:yes stop_codon:yes gene_type:complete
VSDECVRYTGLDIPALGISTGDSLKMVEEAITSYLVPLLTGTGDAIGLDISCPIVDEYLPDHTPNTQELFTATVSAICSLQLQVFTIDDILAALNSDYVIGCLNGVTASSDTHAIVQAIITKLCQTVTDLEALTLDVETNYVKIADFDALVAAYLASLPGGSTQYYLNMIPYTAVEYYGDIDANFDGTGAGLSANGFYKIYLCNGLNGTPDKRGRAGVGAIAGVPGAPLDAAVNPSASTFNPNYTVYDVAGANSVALITSQIPAHSHSATGTTTVTLGDHFHYVAASSGDINAVVDATHAVVREIALSGNSSYRLSNSSTTASVGKSSLDKSTVTSNVPNNVNVLVDNAGGGGAHSSLQPVLACNYIMYIP